MTSKCKYNRYAPYFLSLLILIGIFFCILHGFNFDLEIPFQYNGDTLQFILYIKTTLNTGWFLSDSTLGAPGTYELYDFPLINNVHFFIIKILALFSHNVFVLTNLSYLIGFVLAAWSALYVYRKLELNTSYSIVASILFTLLPYHFSQGEGHLFLASYFAVPIWCFLAFSILNEQSIFQFKKQYWNTLFLIILLECIVNSDAYYLFFGLFFVFFAGIMGSIALKTRQPAYQSLKIIILSTVLAATNLAPNAFYFYEHGRDPQVAHRDFDESEVYGLQIAQMLLPVENHRISNLAHTRYRYDAETKQVLPLMINENASSALGVIASLGLLFSLSIVLLQTACKRASNLYRAASFNILAILLAVPFGFDVLFGMFISPQIRTYTRISVFIGFLSLFVFFRCLQNLMEKHKFKHYLVGLIAAALLIIGAYDQTTQYNEFPKTPTWNNTLENDQIFVAQIENILPPNSMVFQLPYVDFPEGVAPGTMDSYAPFRPYFFSNDIHWSAGAIKGRSVAIWQKTVANLPTSAMINELIKNGFSGIYIDRNGYSDHGKALEAALSKILYEKPLISPNQEFSFFIIKK